LTDAQAAAGRAGQLIAAHRVYWGWLGVGMLPRNEHGALTALAG
jgi:hypothetical protein